MSLGFSVGDFVAVAKLIKEISGCIRHGTTASYQALDLELHTLKRALDEIERLQCPPGQASAFNQVKVAALNCRQPLDQFASKLQAYGILGLQPQTKPDLKSSLGRLAKKVQWGQVIASERKQAAQGSLIKATTGLILEQVSELASAFVLLHSWPYAPGAVLTIADASECGSTLSSTLPRTSGGRISESLPWCQRCMVVCHNRTLRTPGFRIPSGSRTPWDACSPYLQSTAGV